MQNENEAAPSALHEYLASADTASLLHMRRLLAVGADANFSDDHGYRPLHMLAMTCRATPRHVHLLVRAGADATAASHSGFTPLHAYVCFGAVTPQAIRMLTVLQHPSNIERYLLTSMEILGMTDLLCEVSAGVAEALVAAGADVNAADETGCTPLHVYATSFTADAAMVRALLRLGANVHARDRNGRTPLLCAMLSRRANESVVRELLRAGADVNAADASGRTALMLLVSQSANMAILSCLLDAGADAARHNVIRQTAIHYHCHTRWIRGEVLRALMAAGCDARAVDIMRNTALHDAAMYGSCRASQIAPLLEAGVSVNATNFYNRTPLHMAAEFNRVACPRLLAAGADPCAGDRLGNTPFASMVANDLTSSVRAVLPSIPSREIASAIHQEEGLVTGEAARACVAELAARGSLHLMSGEAAREFAPLVGECLRELRVLRATRVGTPPVSLLLVLRSDAPPATLLGARAARRAKRETAGVAVYARQLRARVLSLRRHSALVARVARAVCPCALPPELVSRILLHVPPRDLRATARGITE